MADAYGNRDSRRSNAPMGHFRAELVTVDKADTIVLSGSPVEYFVHKDYEVGDHRVGAISEKLGIAGIWNHDGAPAAWLNPVTYVDNVSRDGYTITLTGAHGIAVGDLLEVYYYSTHGGALEHQSASQVGDVLCPETLDAASQKLNDCPSLNFRVAGMTFDMKMCWSTVKPVAAATTTIAKYSTTQVGTWQAANVPFYVTAIHFTWDGDSIDAGETPEVGYNVEITIDSGTKRNIGGGFLAHGRALMMPTGAGVPSFDQFTVYNLGLCEVTTEFLVEFTCPAGFLTGGTDTFRTAIAGWHG